MENEAILVSGAPHYRIESVLDRGGPPLPSAIPGCTFPLGLLLAESLDLTGPMVI